MLSELRSVENSTTHSFLLFASEERRVIYESTRRQLFVNMLSVESLSPGEDSILSTLLINPNIIQPHEKLYRQIMPSSFCQPDIYEIGVRIRPVIFALRAKLANIDPKLKKIIMTSKKVGYVYVPDKSTLIR